MERLLKKCFVYNKGGAMHARGTAVVLATLVIAGLTYTWVSAQSQTESRNAGSTDVSGTDDVHAAGRTVHIQNEVAGDVAAAGAEVTIDGPVRGYVMSAGRSVTLDGKVGNDVWAAGE